MSACSYCLVEGTHAVGCEQARRLGLWSLAADEQLIQTMNQRTFNPPETHMPAPNPKALRAVADGKAPLDYLEPACDDGEARVLRGGAERYGRRNYRDTEMLWTTYLGSMRRHLNALARGEDTDTDSGEHHLYHIRGCTAVLLGAMEAGTLRDDRLDKVSARVHIDGDQDAKALRTPCGRCDQDGCCTGDCY